MLRLATLVAAVAAAALLASARAEDAAAAAAAAPPPAEDGANALVPDAEPAVIDYTAEKDPCRLLSLKADECANADEMTLMRAFKTTMRNSQRNGGGKEASEAIQIALASIKASRRAAAGEEL